MDPLNIFGRLIATGQIVSVHEVERGDACDCACVVCGHPLQARKGTERAHHFKHRVGTECSVETILHKLGKQVLQEHHRILLPDGKGYYNYETVDEEIGVDDLRPDIILTAPGQLPLHVELAVTHFINAAKYQKIQKARHNTLEIDLSAIDRACSYATLKQLIIDGTEGKEIIYWNVPEAETISAEVADDSFSFLKWFAAIALVVFTFLLFRYVVTNRRRYS
jgi:competence protein CoiA